MFKKVNWQKVVKDIVLIVLSVISGAYTSANVDAVAQIFVS